jgi:mono/diheme cytochrome c family protein
MRKVFACLVVGVMLTPLLSSVVDARGDEYATGRSLYEEKCMICHGANGKGDGPAASGFSKKPADFTQAKVWEGDAEKKIAETIRKGHGPMPAFRLTPDEIKAIIDYMSHAFKKTG